MKFLAFLRTGYGIASGIGLGALGLYYLPRKMLETWDWYLDRFLDEPILEVLREVHIPKRLAPFNPGGPGDVSPTITSIMRYGSYSVHDLADILSRSDRSIGKSIGRLRAKGKIEVYKGGFRLKERS